MEIEPILKENDDRFVIFPIQHDDLWEFYKKQQAAEWTAEGITQAFKNAALHAEAPMRSMYRACYAMFMGSERGPRLAPILANCVREDVCMLAHACSARLS